MSADNLDFLRHIVAHERARFAQLQYEIETKAYDLTTLYRLADAAAEDLARTERILAEREKENGNEE